MKKIVLLVLLSLTAGVCVQAQKTIDTVCSNADTLFIGDREPTFFYGNKWWDECFLSLTPVNSPELGQVNFVLGKWGSGPSGKVEVAKPCYTDTPMKIIGVAAPATVSVTDRAADSSLENRLPEYFRLYYNPNCTNPDSLVMMAEARWDEFQPRYIMELNRWAKIAYYGPNMYIDIKKTFKPVYEAYFDSSIVVDGLFFVAATQNNNYWYQQEFMLAHPITNYYRCWLLGEPRKSCEPDFSYWLSKAHLYDDINYDYWCQDTVHWTTVNSNPSYDGAFAFIFPIFDTSWDGIAEVVDTVCQVPSGLRVYDIGSEGVSLGWDYADSVRWQLSILKDGMPAGAAVISQHSVNSATITNLNAEQWYVARVRTKCDSSHFSDWSDSVMFYVPGDTTGGGDNPNRIETTADRYTYLMPNPASETVTVASSFRIGDVEVYTLEGRRILASRVDGISTTLDISSLPTGTYIVRVSTNNGTAYKKLVVK